MGAVMISIIFYFSRNIRICPILCLAFSKVNIFHSRSTMTIHEFAFFFFREVTQIFSNSNITVNIKYDHYKVHIFIKTAANDRLSMRQNLKGVKNIANCV